MPAISDAAADEALIDLLVSGGARADPYPTYDLLRERTPVLRTAMGTVVLTRYRDCMGALRDPHLGRGLVGRTRRSGGVAGGILGDPELRQRFFDRSADNMLFADPPDHTRLRALVNRAFTPRRVAELRPNVASMTERLLEQLGEEGEAEIMGTLAFPLPNWVIAELVGVPESDRARFRELVAAGSAGIEPVVDDATLQAAMEAQDQMRDYFCDLVAHRRRAPREDLLSGLVAARDAGDSLSDAEIISTAILLFAAGFETTTNLIGNGLLALLRNPDQFERLRSDTSLAPAAVEELLRFDSPVQVNFRTALEESSIDGERLEPGQAVMILQGAANRDPERFERPDRLDVGRADNVPLSFGWGAHHCIGAALARMEGVVVFGALAGAFEHMELAEPDPPWRNRITLRGLASLRVGYRRRR